MWRWWERWKVHQFSQPGVNLYRVLMNVRSGHNGIIPQLPGEFQFALCFTSFEKIETFETVCGRDGEEWKPNNVRHLLFYLGGMSTLLGSVVPFMYDFKLQIPLDTWLKLGSCQIIQLIQPCCSTSYIISDWRLIFLGFRSSQGLVFYFNSSYFQHVY